MSARATSTRRRSPSDSEPKRCSSRPAQPNRSSSTTARCRSASVKQLLAYEDRAGGAAEHDVEHTRPLRVLVDQAALQEADVLAHLAHVDAAEASAEHGHRARVGMLDGRGEQQQAGLARTVRTQHDPVLSGLDREVERPHHDAPLMRVGMGAPHRRRRELDHRHGGQGSPSGAGISRHRMDAAAVRRLRPRAPVARARRRGGACTRPSRRGRPPGSCPRPPARPRPPAGRPLSASSKPRGPHGRGPAPGGRCASRPRPETRPRRRWTSRWPAGGTSRRPMRTPAGTRTSTMSSSSASDVCR